MSIEDSCVNRCLSFQNAVKYYIRYFNITTANEENKPSWDNYYDMFNEFGYKTINRYNTDRFYTKLPYENAEKWCKIVAKGNLIEPCSRSTCANLVEIASQNVYCQNDLGIKQKQIFLSKNP